MTFIEENQKERMRFVEFWARYVREHDDADWSRQQNIIINSGLRSASISKQQFLAMKGELSKNKLPPTGK